MFRFISRLPAAKFTCASLYRPRGSSGSRRTSTHVGTSGSSSTYRRKKPSHLFKENENEAAHKFLESLAEYRKTVKSSDHLSSSVIESAAAEQFKTIKAQSLTPATYFDSSLVSLIKPSSELGIVDRFLQLSDLVRSTDITVEDVRVEPLIVAIVNQQTLFELSDDQLESVIWALRNWSMTESTRTPMFKSIWNSLDIECCKRAPKWSTQTLLRVADCWYHLRLSRITRYNSLVIRLLSDQVASLTPHALIQLLFLINLQREEVVSGVMDFIERALLESFEAFSIEEISVAAMGFFKSRTRLKSHQLVNAISTKLTCNLDKLTDQTLLPVLKLLRFSMKWQNINQYMDLQRRCLPLVDKMSPNTIIHLAFLGKPQLVCHETLLRKMVNRFIMDGLKSIRLKEFARSVLCVALFMPEESQCVEYVRRVAQEMSREHRSLELLHYPDHLVSLLLYASYMNVYPLELLQHCFSPEFLTAIEENGSLNINRELYTLDCGIQIECPKNAIASRLPLVQRTKICQEIISEVNETSVHNKCLQDVSGHLARIIGSEDYVHVVHLLPHFIQKDLLLILDKAGNLKPIPIDVITSPPGAIIERNTDDKWLCFVIQSSRTAPGRSHVKKRQLQALGHSVYEVPWVMYKDMKEDKLKQYLSNLIFT